MTHITTHIAVNEKIYKNYEILTNSMTTYLLASSSLRLASISLLGGYWGRLEGSQAKGSVLKNCKTQIILGMNANYIVTINDWKASTKYVWLKVALFPWWHHYGKKTHSPIYAILPTIWQGKKAMFSIEHFLLNSSRQ